MAATALLVSGDAGARTLIAGVALSLGLALALGVALRSRAAGGAAPVALIVAALFPLTVRDGVRASFQAADTPTELLIYTQSSPHLKRIEERIDELAAVSGLGNRLPIVVDSASAYTWPWAWYLRDYRDVKFLDLDREGRTRLAETPRPMVLLAASGNDRATEAWPDAFGPGEPYAHRWWFPEEGYRRTTGPRFLDWLRDAAMWRTWRDYVLDRTLDAPLGTTDAVAFFPADFRPADGGNAPAMMRPREEQGRLIVGNPGLSAGAFDQPAGVAVAPDGTLLVADSRNRRVQRFDAEGEWLATTGPDAWLREPWAVTTDARGFVYVTDAGTNQVLKLDHRLRPVARWGAQAADGDEPQPLELRGPRGIAIGPDGAIWVADTGNDRLVKLASDGRPLAVVNGSDTAVGPLREPAGLAVAPNGDLLVADAGNGRIVRFDAAMGAASEIQIDNWRAPDAVQSRPALALLDDGSIVATVPDEGRVRLLTPDGTLRHVWDRLGNRSSGGWPLGVAVDQEGHVWASDGVSHQVVRLPPP